MAGTDSEIFAPVLKTVYDQKPSQAVAPNKAHSLELKDKQDYYKNLMPLVGLRKAHGG
jgi:hypothetical protein